MCTIYDAESHTYSKKLHKCEVVPGIKLEYEHIVHASSPPAKCVDSEPVEPDAEYQSGTHGAQRWLQVRVAVVLGGPLAECNTHHNNTQQEEPAEQAGKVRGPVGAAVLCPEGRDAESVHGLGSVPVLQLDHALLHLPNHPVHVLGGPEIGAAHGVLKDLLPVAAVGELVVLLEDLAEAGVVELLEVLQED